MNKRKSTRSSLKSRLLKAGEPTPSRDWVEFDKLSYIERCKLTRKDIPDLIEIVKLWDDSDWVEEHSGRGKGAKAKMLLPVSAWRALAELKAAEAGETMIGMLNSMAIHRDDWALEDFPYVFARFGPEVLPALIEFASDPDNHAEARSNAVQAMVEIAKRDEVRTASGKSGRSTVETQLTEWIQSAVENPVAVEAIDGEGAGYPAIRFNSAVLKGLLDLNVSDAAEAIERAFAKNQIDCAFAGDWEAIRKELGVPGLGLKMPKDPLDSMAALRSKLGVNSFCDKPLFSFSGGIDGRAAEEYYNNALERFAQSKEGKEAISHYGDIQWVRPFLELGLQRFAVTINTITVEMANAIVFELIPEHLDVKADNAESIIVELRLFWRFVKRVYGLAPANTLVKRLDDKAIEQLESALSDPRRFGPAKSMLVREKSLAVNGLSSDASSDLESTRDQGIHGSARPQQPDMSAEEKKKALKKRRKKQLARQRKQKGK